MDKILEALVEIIQIIPFTKRLQAYLGYDEKVCAAWSALIAFLLCYSLVKIFKAANDHSKNSKTARELGNIHFDYLKIKKARELFIPTFYQNESPVREEEPSFSHRFVARSALISFFMKTGFDGRKESDKFYLVLADSGMGKTTFMINLYVSYTSFFNFSRKYKIRLLPFGDQRILDMIKEIDKKDVQNTILLLDAFDEDKGLVPTAKNEDLSDDDRFRQRLDEIIEAVQDFREVVITSRTQYFPGKDDQPYELKIPRFDEQGFHKLAKFYLSPFSEKDINRYLNKKYGLIKIWNQKKKKVAADIVNNSPKLMARPMLLSYIDYLVDDTRMFKTTYEIYEVLIDKWVEREANKRKHKNVDREKFINDLYKYSQLVAMAIYDQRQSQDLYYLPKDEAIAVARQYEIDLQEYEITGQSLLTRDVLGNWKFAHKSILEFFLAQKCMEDLKFAFQFEFSGMDMTRYFCDEIIPMSLSLYVKINGHEFLMGSPENEADRHEKNELQHPVKIDTFFMSKYAVTVAQFESFIKATGYETDADIGGSSGFWNGKKWADKKGVNWRHDVNGNEQTDKKHPVINVSWNDATAYCAWLQETTVINFRLPYEAQWEFACRAGTTTPFNTGDNLTTDQANYNGNYPYNKNPKGKYLKKTMPVGSYPPNAWGLCEMHGNVWEWCRDWYGEEYYDECKKQGLVENPTGPGDGSDQVLRGGSWCDVARYCRCADRSTNGPYYRGTSVGFRLVFVP